ncbi:MAG: hypothetical protein WAM73_14890, partial [Desulfobacterales bacterium]
FRAVQLENIRELRCSGLDQNKTDDTDRANEKNEHQKTALKQTFYSPIILPRRRLQPAPHNPPGLP